MLSLKTYLRMPVFIALAIFIRLETAILMALRFLSLSETKSRIGSISCEISLTFSVAGVLLLEF
jgi:hypothetical protein